MMRATFLLLVTSFALLGAGCEVLSNVVGDAMGKHVDPNTQKLIKSGVDLGKSAIKAAESFTLEQEYYIGRSVAAQIIHRYGVFDDESCRRYISRVGNALTSCSAAPETFSGYHYLILDSDEINAFAAPGAFIFVTRGMLRCCESEDELAAVLAHEIAHIEKHHAIGIIKGTRRTDTMLLLGQEAASHSGQANVKKLTDAFGGVLEDVVSSLIEKGYDRSQELDSDRSAVTIMASAGYDPAALIRVLENMGEKLESAGSGFGSTHPPAADRISEVRALISGEQSIPSQRTARFTAALNKARADSR